MGVETKYQLKDKIRIFSPFMKYKLKQCISLLKYTNWKLINWNMIVIKNSSLAKIKICAQRYRDIASTNKTYRSVWKMSTNQNRWYQLKAYIHKNNIWVYNKSQNWYQLKEFNDTNWNNNNVKCITHIPIFPTYAHV